MRGFWFKIIAILRLTALAAAFIFTICLFVAAIQCGIGTVTAEETVNTITTAIFVILISIVTFILIERRC